MEDAGAMTAREDAATCAPASTSADGMVAPGVYHVSHTRGVLVVAEPQRADGVVWGMYVEAGGTTADHLAPLVGGRHGR